MIAPAVVHPILGPALWDVAVLAVVGLVTRAASIAAFARNPPPIPGATDG